MWYAIFLDMMSWHAHFLYILTTDHVDRGNARSYSDHDGIIPWMSSPRTTVGYVWKNSLSYLQSTTSTNMYKHNKIQRCCVTKIVNRDRMCYAILLFCEVTTLSPCITTNSFITWNSYLCSRIPIEWDFGIDVVLVLPIDDNSRISCVSIDSKSRYLCMPATRVSPRSRVGRDRYFRLNQSINQSINPFRRINQLAFPRRRSRFTTRATQFEDWFR